MTDRLADLPSLISRTHYDTLYTRQSPASSVDKIRLNLMKKRKCGLSSDAFLESEIDAGATRQTRQMMMGVFGRKNARVELVVSHVISVIGTGYVSA
jgi:hypothetical protein